MADLTLADLLQNRSQKVAETTYGPFGEEYQVDPYRQPTWREPFPFWRQQLGPIGQKLKDQVNQSDFVRHMGSQYGQVGERGYAKKLMDYQRSLNPDEMSGVPVLPGQPY